MDHRRRVVEIFSTDDERSRELLNRLFRMPLRNCVVHVRPSERGGPRGMGPLVRVDGRTLEGSPSQRISTKLLLDALER